MMLSIDVRQGARDLHSNLAQAFDFVGNMVTSPPPLSPPLWVPTFDNLSFKRCKSEIDRFVYSIIDERVQSRRGSTNNGSLPQDTNDFLDLLLDARDPDTGAALSREQLRDETITMVGGGYETSSNLLTWTFLCLAQHADVERKVYEELARVVGDREPTVEDLPKLTYMKMMLDEVMRLYPPFYVFMRDAVEDDVIGGVPVRKGANLLVCPFILHRHPHFWENPDAFDPERFRQPPANQYAYIPFGAGQRVCIGSNFALIEAMLVLAGILQKFRIELRPAHTPIGLSATTMLQPNIPVSVYVKPRNQGR